MRLHQILGNLLSNAIKFTSAGKITLTAQMTAQKADSILLQFAITDTGIGIPANKMDRLFHYFSQVDDFITQKYGGSGLGLFIAKELVTKMGGEISVNSEQGKGSTFGFTASFKLPPGQNSEPPVR